MPVGNSRLTINVVASGIAAPVIVIENIAKPSTEAEFCGELTKPGAQLNQFGQSGTVTINSCSFNGTTAQVRATVSITTPIALNIPYTVTYTYN